MSTIPKKIAFHTLGCKTNYSETSSISREIIKSGFEKVGYNELAVIYVLNTCSVTENANKDARKFVRKAKRNNPNATNTTPTGNTSQNNLNDSSVTALVRGAGPVRVIVRFIPLQPSSTASQAGKVRTIPCFAPKAKSLHTAS